MTTLITSPNAESIEFKTYGSADSNAGPISFEGSANPNAHIVAKHATTTGDHRRAWKAVARSAQRDIENALSTLEDNALAAFHADDTRLDRWRRLPPNLGHLLALAAGVAESAIAAAELDLVRARRALGIRKGTA